MKRKLSGFVSLLFLLVWTGCTREVELILPEQPPRLVLNASLSPQGDVSAALSKSWFLLDSVPFHRLDGGTIRVYVNEQYRGEMQPPSHPADSFSPPASFVLPGCRVHTGDRVRLEAEAPGFDPVQATTTIPSPVEILSLDTARFLTSGIYMGEVPRMRLQVRFQDKPGERNYYRLIVEKMTEYRKGDEVVVTSSLHPSTQYWENSFFLAYEDPVFRTGTNNPGLEELDGYTCRGIFTDDLFAGQSYTLSSSFFPVTDSYCGDSVVSVVHYDIRLLSISESYYRYLTVIRRFSITLGEAYLSGLLEPASTYTNVEEGFGVVCGYQVASKRITMPFGDTAPTWTPWSASFSPYD